MQPASGFAVERIVCAAFVAAATFALPARAQAPAVAAPKEKGPTTIDAERIDGVSDLEFSARGKAEIRRDDTTIFGEQLRFNREFERFEADGGVRLERGSDRFFGPRLRYNAKEGTGEFEAPTYLIQRDPPARGRAEHIEFLGPDRYRMTKGTFTTCEPGREDWRLEVGELDLDYESREGKVRDARLRFFDATIVSVPYFSFALENQRKTGFLMPTYGRSTRRGFELGVPYYLNLAPEIDATLTPVTMSKRGAQLKTDLRYIGAGYSGEMRVEHMPEDKDLRRSRSGFALLHEQQITPQLYTRIDLNKVTDHRYFVDLASRVQQVSVGNLLRDGQLSYGGGALGFAYGTTLRVQRFQTLQDPLAPTAVPYHRVPQITFAATRNDVGGLADIAIPAEYVRFSHPSLVEGLRTSLNPTVSIPVLAPGYFINPKFGMRYITYSLDRTGPGQIRAPSARIPWMSADAGLIFERPVAWFGDKFTQTLEPRAFYVRIPYKDQNRMPVFDTVLADFNYSQIFSENRFAGGDRYGDANQLTVAATSRLVGAGGEELLRATIGQRYYFGDEKVGLTAASPLNTLDTSHLLASVGGRIDRHWSFDATTQFDPQESRAQKYSASVRYAPEIAKVMNLSYRFNRDLLRQVDLSGQWPVSPGWYAVGRLNYSLRDRLVLEGLGGLEYNAGCWVFRAVGRRIQVAAQTASTEILFQIEFNGLGQIGSDDTLTLLKRNVPGYAQTNPADRSLVPPSLQRRLPFEQIF